jgi:hypothetical protein
LKIIVEKAGILPAVETLPLDYLHLSILLGDPAMRAGLHRTSLRFGRKRQPDGFLSIPVAAFAGM